MGGAEEGGHSPKAATAVGQAKEADEEAGKEEGEGADEEGAVLSVKPSAASGSSSGAWVLESWGVLTADGAALDVREFSAGTAGIVAGVAFCDWVGASGPGSAEK